MSIATPPNNKIILYNKTSKRIDDLLESIDKNGRFIDELEKKVNRLSCSIRTSPDIFVFNFYKISFKGCVICNVCPGLRKKIAKLGNILKKIFSRAIYGKKGGKNNEHQTRSCRLQSDSLSARDNQINECLQKI